MCAQLLVQQLDTDLPLDLPDELLDVLKKTDFKSSQFWELAELLGGLVKVCVPCPLPQSHK